MSNEELRIIEAAKWANFCPDAGGYRNGRSVEDCYEELNAALNDYYGTDIQVPVLVVSQFNEAEGKAHHYIHWPRERFCWFKDEPEQDSKSKQEKQG